MSKTRMIAESHIDRSILNTTDFIKTDVWGTLNLYNSALRNNVKKFLPIMISHGSNNYGPYQFSEKIIPLFIANLINKKNKNEEKRLIWDFILDPREYF